MNNKKEFLTIWGLGNSFGGASMASAFAVLVFLGIEHVLPFRIILESILFLAVLGYALMCCQSEKEFVKSDPKEVVIDEWLGMFVCLIIAGEKGLIAVGIQFVLFRILDIFKPPPFKDLERKIQGTSALIWDDVVIGVVVGILTRLVYLFI